jgi:hypothetical protein
VKTGRWQQGDAPGAGAAENADVREWIAKFTSLQVAVRKQATEKLIALGPRAMPDVRQAMLSDDAEVRARAEAVARGLEREATAYFVRRGLYEEKILEFLAPEVGIRGLTLAAPPNGEPLRVSVADMEQLTCLYRITSLTLGDYCDITDDLMPYVGRLSGLDELVVAAPNITDEGLVRIGKLTALTKLRIQGTKITGRGVAAFAGIDSLEEISFHGCPLTDDSISEGMRGLSNHRHVRILHLAGCPISDAALAAISGIHSLESLSLVRTDVTDHGLRTLSSLPNLVFLNLLDTGTTDAGIPHVAKFPALRGLLPSQNVTASGLRPLSELRTLERLVLIHHKLRRSDAVELINELRPHGVGVQLPRTFVDEKP